MLRRNARLGSSLMDYLLEGDSGVLYLEVKSAVLALRAALEGTAVAAEEVRLARHSMELAEGRYKVGVGRLIEVTDARAALTTALTDEVGAAYDYQTSQVAVARAMGSLPTEAIPADE